LAAPIPVDVLPREEAIAFLERRVGLDQHDANALAESLGDPGDVNQHEAAWEAGEETGVVGLSGNADGLLAASSLMDDARVPVGMQPRC
jgi:hypothetical protein